MFSVSIGIFQVNATQFKFFSLFTELLNVHYKPDPDHDQQEILMKLSEYCGKSVYNYTEGEVDPLKWDFYNSLYFSYTVVSTIGG